MSKENCRACRGRELLKKAGLPEFVSVGELSDFLDLSPRRIQQLTNEGWLHRDKKGRYNFFDCIQGYVEYLRDQIIAKFQGRHER